MPWACYAALVRLLRGRVLEYRMDHGVTFCYCVVSLPARVSARPCDLDVQEVKIAEMSRPNWLRIPLG